MIYSQFSELFDDMGVKPSFGAMLYGLVLALRPTVVVETGTHNGFSTAYIAQALKDNQHGHVTTYDINNYGAQKALNGLGLGEYVTCKKQDSREVSEKDIDFAFIDSEHSGDFVIEEWNNIKGRLSPHAVVVWENMSTANHERWPNFGVRRIMEVEQGVYLPAPNGAFIYYHGGQDGPGGIQMR